MAEQARIRISLSAGELEVEGAESFVGKYADSIQALLDRLKTAKVAPGRDDSAIQSGVAPPVPATEHREFGEVLHSLPSNAPGPDQMLVAGSYAQQASADSTFSTGEANQLLLGQGVKLSNPSQALKNAIAAKRVFKVGKRYRLSKAGEEHLKSLTG